MEVNVLCVFVLVEEEEQAGASASTLVGKHPLWSSHAWPDSGLGA